MQTKSRGAIRNIQKEASRFVLFLIYEVTSDFKSEIKICVSQNYNTRKKKPQSILDHKTCRKVK